ncbi:hypothetical protein BN2475_580056 [Paraburkholderia ribeironis]|uniref:Uncharacterized protein n=1 Tax=Paraburkholderia ribeironis TaxID=1247936 RepID=A0A1N7SEE1_9BURK|nr:hypothetical protein BN2475_580056 [Paraburkholderia ribeironis]
MIVTAQSDLNEWWVLMRRCNQPRDNVARRSPDRCQSRFNRHLSQSRREGNQP